MGRPVASERLRAGIVLVVLSMLFRASRLVPLLRGRQFWRFTHRWVGSHFQSDIRTPSTELIYIRIVPVNDDVATLCLPILDMYPRITPQAAWVDEVYRIVIRVRVLVESVGIIGLGHCRVHVVKPAQALPVLPIHCVIAAGFGVPLVAREVMFVLRAALPEILAERKVRLPAEHSALSEWSKESRDAEFAPQRQAGSLAYIGPPEGGTTNGRMMWAAVPNA